MNKYLNIQLVYSFHWYLSEYPSSTAELASSGFQDNIFIVIIYVLLCKKFPKASAVNYTKFPSRQSNTYFGLQLFPLSTNIYVNTNLEVEHAYLTLQIHMTNFSYQSFWHSKLKIQGN